MDIAAPSLPARTEASSGGLSRRSMIAGAAWSVPVIVAVTATPAFAAASNASVVTASTPGMQTPASGQVVVTAVVKNSSGVPLSGQSVSFTGPSGTSFSPTSATTDGSGTATSTLTTTDAWALPGSSVTVTALSNGASGTAALTVLGANAYSLGENESHAAPAGSSTTSPVQLQQAFPSPVVSIATSFSDAAGPRLPFTLALLRDGTVWAVGTNIQGQMGDGTTTDHTTWARVPGLSGVVEIATRFGTAYALLSDRTIRSWGSNAHGQLGDGSSVASSSTPVTVTGITTAVRLAGGLALLSDGSIRSWGSGYGGRLGNGTTSDANTPVTVTGITTAVNIAAATNTAYAILSDGTIRSWGANDDGALGNGTYTSSSTPVAVNGISTALDIACASTTAYALLADGSIRSWGYNGAGELGNGSSDDNSKNPVIVSGISTATAITATSESGYAMLTDGTVMAWGSGPGTNSSTPATISGTQNVTTLATDAFSQSSTIYLIIGDRLVSFSNASATTITAGSTATVAAVVKANDANGAALARQSVTFTTGNAASVTPTSGTTDSSGAVSTTVTSTDPWSVPGSTLTVTADSAGYAATRGLSVIGSNVYVAGSNSAGEAGTGTGSDPGSTAVQTARAFPSPVRKISSSSGTLALLQDGTVWSVGANDYGQLGDGTTTSRSTWAQVPGLSNVTDIGTGFTCSFAVADGYVYAWGFRYQGSLGDGNDGRSNQLTPLRLTTLPRGATAISPASAGSYALVNGQVYAWGDNHRLGNGTTSDGFTSTPVPVTGMTHVTQLASGYYGGYALQDGNVYAWGLNGFGQIGDGTSDDRPSPVQVLGLSNVTQVVASQGGVTAYALAGGAVHAWGGNMMARWNADGTLTQLYGMLGDGSTVDQSTTPVTVSGLTSPTLVGASGIAAFAVTRDGVRAWGGNNDGRLADGTTADYRTTPVPVAGMTGVTSFSNGYGVGISGPTFFIRG